MSQLFGNYVGFSFQELQNNIYNRENFISEKEPQVFITPIKKNKTNNASPIAFTDSFMLKITFHISPPLKVSGDVVINEKISESLLFHTLIAFCK